MGDVTDIMSKFNQIQLLCFWISDNTKYKVITTFNGKDGEVSIKLYESDKSVKCYSSYKVENMWVKADAIVLKEMDNIIQHLLIIKNKT